MARAKTDMPGGKPGGGAPDAPIDDAPLPPEIAAMRAELAELAHAVAAISARLDQDCATAQMLMKAPESRHGRGDLPAVKPILSASSYYAVADLDRVYPRIGVAMRTLRALAAKYGS